MFKEKTPLTLEQKVDKILAYHKKARNRDIAKLIFNILLIILLIALPFLIFNWIGNYFQELFGMTGQEVADALQKVKDIKEFNGVEKIKEWIN